MDNFDNILNILNIESKSICEDLCLNIMNEEINFIKITNINENLILEAQDNKKNKIIKFVRNFFDKLLKIVNEFFNRILNYIKNIFDKNKIIQERVNLGLENFSDLGNILGIFRNKSKITKFSKVTELGYILGDRNYDGKFLNWLNDKTNKTFNDVVNYLDDINIELRHIIENQPINLHVTLVDNLLSNIEDDDMTKEFLLLNFGITETSDLEDSIIRAINKPITTNNIQYYFKQIIDVVLGRDILMKMVKNNMKIVKKYIEGLSATAEHIIEDSPQYSDLIPIVDIYTRYCAKSIRILNNLTHRIVKISLKVRSEYYFTIVLNLIKRSTF